MSEMTVPRKKLAKSCDACRSNKRRCNSQDPCAFCKSREIKCTYSTVNKPGIKPGFGKETASRLKALEEQNQLILERMQLLEGQFNRMQNFGLEKRNNETAPSLTLLLNPPYPQQAGMIPSDHGLPRVETIIQLVDAFFQYVFPIFPILHPRQTRAKIDTYIGQFDAGENFRTIGPKEPPLVLYGIIINAIPYVLVPDLEALCKLCKQKIVLDGYSVSSLKQLQAITLLAFHTLGNNNGTESWSLIGIATSGAIQLNLSDSTLSIPPLPTHSPQSDISTSQPTNSKVSALRAQILKSPQSWIEAETRRRLFWGIYTLDVLSAVTSGLPRKLPNSEVRIEPPILTELWVGEMDEPDGFGSLDAFSHFIKACQFFGDVHSFLLQPHDICSKPDVGNWFFEFHKLENNIERWRDNLPEPFRTTLHNNILPDLDHTSYKMCVLFHSAYNVMMIKLHSAYGYPHAESVEFTHSVSSRRLCLDAVNNVITAAVSVLEVERNLGISVFQQLGPFYAFHIWVCSRLLIADYIFKQKDSQPVDKEILSEHLKFFCEILHSIGKYWGAAYKYYRILRQLINLDVSFDTNAEANGSDIEPSSAIADMRINTHLLSMILSKKLKEATGTTDDEIIELEIADNHELLEVFKLDSQSHGLEDFFKFLDNNNFSG